MRPAHSLASVKPAVAPSPLPRGGRAPRGLQGGRPHTGARLSVTVAAGEKGDREPWDIARFARTVMFFNPVPGPLEFIKRVFSGISSGGLSPSADLEARKSAILRVLAPGELAPGSMPSGGGTRKQDMVLVTGATGGVGRRVVQRLFARGDVRVRALVRDTSKAAQLLAGLPGAPDRLEVVAADLTQRATMQPFMFEGVRAVVSCASTVVTPKEGDDVRRSKYYQGIKFYDPEIPGDTPEMVELQGMQHLIDAIRLHVRAGGERGPVIFPAPGVTFGALDDVVMGGVSSSRLDPPARPGDPAVFRGVVSEANSGGFASTRSRNFEPPLDLGAYEGVELRVRGNGLRYKLILRCDPGWDSISYCRSFDTVAGEWHTVRVPFSEMAPVFRARMLRGGEAVDPTRVCSIQLMLSKFEYDGELSPAFRAGAFELPIEYIAPYSTQAVTPRVVHVSSAGVTRCDRPGIDVNMEPPAVRLNDQLGGLLTYKLAGEDALRASGIPHAIVRPTALTEEPAGADLVVDQGDTIKGKVSREDVADLCVALLDLPMAANTTFEIKSTVPFSEEFRGAPGAAARDWRQILSTCEGGLRPGVTGKTINGVYTGREVENSAAQVASR